MHAYHLDRFHPKGWLTGPWDSNLPISVGYANSAVDEPHLHQSITEIYLVGGGMAEIRIENETWHLESGDVVVVEPGEAHTFLSSSPDYFHFVIHTPGLAGMDARNDKIEISRERLGLA